jgi:tRNA(fMet)-specific endonuclease VapC
MLPANLLGPGSYFPTAYEPNGYLLDTMHTSALSGGVSTVVQQVNRFPPETMIATCDIVVGELAYGAYNANPPERQEYLFGMEILPRTVAILPTTPRIGYVYGMIKMLLMNRYGPTDKKARENFSIPCDLGISDNDIWIAATAIFYQLILVTDDNDFQRIRAVTGLPVERWN